MEKTVGGVADGVVGGGTEEDGDGVTAVDVGGSPHPVPEQAAPIRLRANTTRRNPTFGVPTAALPIRVVTLSTIRGP